MNGATLWIDPSQFPQAVQEELIAGLRARQINHKFHYMTYRQAEKWMALHEAHSPARRDPDCQAIYDKAFAAAGKAPVKEVVGLGCGSGQKDGRLLAKMKRVEAHYTPVDVSLPLVLRARQVWPEELVRSAIVCDLAKAERLPLEAGPKLITFFGMLPNFEPNVIIPRLSSLLAKNDQLLCSANLAPGSDYAQGMRAVLPQYENALTDDWLMTFLLDLGVERDSGTIEWSIELSSGLMRIVACFRFARAARVTYANHVFKFAADERIRLFFSYRYTPYLLQKLLAEQGIKVKDQWITQSEEEGVFFCEKK